MKGYAFFQVDIYDSELAIHWWRLKSGSPEPQGKFQSNIFERKDNSNE